MLAEAMGMRVIFHDLADKLCHGNTEPAGSLEALLKQSDVVSLHVPETQATRGMIGPAEIRQMKPGAILINNARGTVVDLDALAPALQEGHIGGAAIDVFPLEPSSNGQRFTCPLQGLPYVILTPHIGGSTEEAQARIGSEVARKLADYVGTGATLGAVNFPQAFIPARPRSVRFAHLHLNLPGTLGRINDVFAHRGINIAGQILETQGNLGYLVVDADPHPGDPERGAARAQSCRGHSASAAAPRRLSVWFRNEVRRVIPEAVGLFGPGFQDKLGGHQPTRGLEPTSMIVGSDEQMQMCPKLGSAVIVLAFGRRVLDRAVRSLNPPSALGTGLTLAPAQSPSRQMIQIARRTLSVWWFRA